MRPWSFSVSFVPVALTAAVLIVEGRDVEWFDVITLVQGANFAHAAANLINTLFDFHSGLDKSATADDRSLVDKVVSQNTLWGLTVFFLVQAGAVCGYYVSTRGVASFLPVAAAGIGLGIAYTAKPLSLKYLGLGDIAIFAAFGPVVMAGASVGMIGWVPHSVMWLSIPTGMATTAILHANNARDIKVDTDAGARTCATVLHGCTARRHRSEHSPFNLNSLYFTFLLLGSWALGLLVVLAQIVQNTLKPIPASAFRVTPLHTRIAVALSSLAGYAGAAETQAAIGAYLPNATEDASQHSWEQTGVWGKVNVQRDAQVPALIAVCVFATALPWALALVARFRRGGSALATLPQQTAQWVMWSGVVTCMGLVPLVVTARFCLAILFALGGVNNLIMWHHACRLVQCKLSYVAGITRDALCCGAGRSGVQDHAKLLPLPLAGVALAAAVAAQVAASVAFMFDMHAREAALVLVAFLVPVTFIVHDFWNMDLEANKWDTKSEQDALAAWNTMQSVQQQQQSGTGQKEQSGKESAMPKRGSRSRSAARSRGSAEVDGGASEELEASSPTAAPSPAATGDQNWAPLNSRAVPNFMDTFSSEFVHFFQNIGMLGGLLVFIVLTGPGGQAA